MDHRHRLGHSTENEVAADHGYSDPAVGQAIAVFLAVWSSIERSTLKCVDLPGAAEPFGGWVGRNRHREYKILAGRDRKEVLSRALHAALGVEISSHHLSPAAASPPEVT